MKKISLELLENILRDISDIEDIKVVPTDLNVSLQDYFGMTGKATSKVKAGVYVYGEPGKDNIQAVVRFDDDLPQGQMMGFVKYESPHMRLS